jgi:hypothetical protein
VLPESLWAPEAITIRRCRPRGRHVGSKVVAGSLKKSDGTAISPTGS